MAHIDSETVRAQLKDRGIDPDHIKALHVKMLSGELDSQSFVIPKSRLRAPTHNDVTTYESLDQTDLEKRGLELLQQDALLVFWLNGGAATRYFDDTTIRPDEASRYSAQLANVTPEMRRLPKGVTPVINNQSYLELKIRNLLHVTRQAKLEVHPRVILMNSFITDMATRAHLQDLFKKYPDLDPSRFHFIVQQPTIPRFTKVEDMKNIDLFVDPSGALSYAPCGHGDFIFLLQEYLRETPMPGAQYMFFANIDNLGSSIDPVLLGAHASAHATSGIGRTVELAQKYPGDKGGAPCFVDNELMIVEQMKFPPDFDQAQIQWFNTNTFWFTLSDLINFKEDLPLVLAEKTIKAGTVFQVEHFACDVHLPSEYIVIPRNQRFVPVKRYVDLLIYQDSENHSSTHTAFVELMRNCYDIELPTTI